ncbi:DUF5686 family protein [Pontibacter silvestris]|uniref:DUF5686 family protein n=1 Tax=Pontibacter silvestris TaxID=2305183 RepID=A0ABW4X294_9BACT|nr:DUF5686 and carboxypeptidase-like regulatory domain-containing protein [Pontibacter silvestris]MCC9135868.1 DUF5686 and carboxypeptidase regulatory-like domain-containing protein [Pontibacter silvestris]
MLRFILLFFFAILFVPTIAQVREVRGVVRDARSNERLPFVSIAANEGETGTTTNLDGEYQLRHSHPISSIRFSYVGYNPQIVYPDSAGALNIYLQPVAARLEEVVIMSGENPAHRIVRLANRNRQLHKLDNLQAYTYRSYNKFILSASPQQEIDVNKAATLSAADSSFLKMRNMLNRQHLFLSESITDYAYLKPNNHKETILATRVSGLQQPNFGIVAVEARDFSVYDDMPVFFGKHYLSPLSTGSTSKYDFILEETSVVGQDTTFIISYKPERGRNFEGLKGLLYINSNGWAVQNIIAESAADDKRGIKLQQQYKLINGRQWFPTELDVEITIPQIQLRGHQPYGLIRTYITNINLSPNLKRADFGVIALHQEPDAHLQPDSFWQQYRSDSLSSLDLRTYQRLDSVGRADGLDRTIRTFEALASQQIPIGAVSLNLKRFLRISRFEGLRLGIGAHTNNRFSERFTIGGYWAYGFKDEKQKYGADASFILHQPSEFTLAATFFEDVLEPGGRRLPFKPQNTLFNFRSPVLTNLDYTTHSSVALSGRLLRYVQLQTMLRKEQRHPTLGITSTEDQPSVFNITEASAGFRFAYGEHLIQQFGMTMPVATHYPTLWLQYTRGINGLLNGDYSYNKLDARVEASFRQRSIGLTSITLAGGLVQGNAPFVGLYNGFGSYHHDYKVYAGEGFETMGPYDFFSDRYAALFFKQDFGKLLFRTRYFQPTLAVVTNVGFGDLNKPLSQLGEASYQTMQKGFYESGLLLNNIISSTFTGVGIGAFYRYGPYALDSTKDNLKFKLTMTFAF